jgi:hypothetical protein
MSLQFLQSHHKLLIPEEANAAQVTLVTVLGIINVPKA